MKTALILTGFLRSNYPFSQSFRQFANDPDVDIYACCWSINSTGAPGGKSRHNHQPVTIEDIQRRYGENVRTKIVDYHHYQGNRPYTFTVREDRAEDVFKVAPRAIQHLKVGYPQRIIDMFYMVKEARDMVPDFRQYDQIIKSRHDMCIDTSINFVANNLLNIDDHQQILDLDDASNIEARNFNRTNMTHLDMKPFALSYQLAWGNPEIMYRYMSAYDYLRFMYEEHNVDLSAYEHVNACYIMNVMGQSFAIHAIQDRYHFVR